MGVRWEAYTGNEITNVYIFGRGSRWVYVGKTQVPPPEFYGKARRSFKIGMLTTVNPSDGEDMYVDSTDAESPGWKDPRRKNQRKNQKWKKKKNAGMVWKT